MSADQSPPQSSPNRAPHSRAFGSAKLVPEPRTLRSGVQQPKSRMPKKCIRPTGYDPSRDSMDAAGQAFELFLHVDTLRKQISLGLGPPCFVNADGSLLFSRKATAAWLEQRKCRNLLEVANVRRADAKVRSAARRKKVGHG